MPDADDADYEIQPGQQGPHPDRPAMPAAGSPVAVPGPLPDPQADTDDEFSLPPLPEPPRPPAAPAPETHQDKPGGDEAAPDLEAIYRAATGMGAVQADVMEVVTANHAAWYAAWQEAGLSEKRSFALLRVMVREQCRS